MLEIEKLPNSKFKIKELPKQDGYLFSDEKIAIGSEEHILKIKNIIEEFDKEIIINKGKKYNKLLKIFDETLNYFKFKYSNYYIYNKKSIDIKLPGNLALAKINNELRIVYRDKGKSSINRLYIEDYDAEVFKSKFGGRNYFFLEEDQNIFFTTIKWMSEEWKRQYNKFIEINNYNKQSMIN